jgi:hypothetical protein
MITQDLWAIKKNHGYSFKKYLCSHFDVDIDHESSTGILGLGWINRIIIKVYYKPECWTKILINSAFNKNNTEFQDYKVFSDKVVIHARISDFRNNYPTIGNYRQNEIVYKERWEHERLEKLRREQQRKELLKLF